MRPLNRYLLAAGLVISIVPLGTGPSAAQDPDEEDLFDGRTIDFELPQETVHAKSLLREGNEKVDPSIRALVAEASGLDGDGLTVVAKNLGVTVGARRAVAVALTPEPGVSADDLIAEAEANGAEVSIVFGDIVYAHVPLDSVNRLGGSADLSYMNRQVELRPAYPGIGVKGIKTDGVRSVRAVQLHKNGISGAGVKVGIIDFGFDRYSELQKKGRLPAPAATRVFRRAGKLENGNVHGTACAEIVHAMAPGAALYLAAIGGVEDQVIQAALWLAEQGVDILSFSGGSHGGPHNGRSILDQLVEETADKGILWVNAAGNDGDAHWGGKAIDRNGDGWIEIGRKGENFMVIRPTEDNFRATIVWDDWGSDPKVPSSTQDIDAFLYQYNRRREPIKLVSQSVNPQHGRGAPREYIGGNFRRNRRYLLGLRASNITRPVTLHVYSNTKAALAPNEPQGSIMIPATSEAALSVGAVNVATNRLEVFSSRGPTDDGRMKPEVSAPDRTQSQAYASLGGRFPGTSAACPHVSGFAALLKQMRPTYRGPELREAVLRSVRPMGEDPPEPGYGRGYIDASTIRVPNISSDTTVDLPQEWGGRVAAQELDEFLDRSGRDEDFNVKVSVRRRKYRVGDGLKIRYQATSGCHYLLLHRDSTGRYGVISPSGDRSRLLEGGEKYSLPDDDGELRITEPAGVDEVILIGSSKPMDLADRESDGSVAVAKARYRVVQ